MTYSQPHSRQSIVHNAIATFIFIIFSCYVSIVYSHIYSHALWSSAIVSILYYSISNHIVHVDCSSKRIYIHIIFIW